MDGPEGRDPAPEQERLPGFDRPTPDPDDGVPSEISSIVVDPPQTPGRVDAGEAVTGDRATPSGEAPPGGDPGQDSSLEGDR